MAFYVDNAICWAQLRIRGGWKNLLSISLTYAGIAGVSIAIGYQIAEYPGDKRHVLSVSSTMLLGAQTLMMLLLAGMSIAGTIRRDVTTLQIESHRLMPLSPAQAVSGYVVGASLHILALCLANFLMGGFLILLAGTPLSDWLAVNAMLFVFALSIWTAMAMAAFISRGMFGLFLGVCGATAFSGGLIFILVPGLLAFCSPMHGRTIFQPSSISRLTTGVIVAIAAQVLFMILWIRCAARKYADASAPGFTVGSALATLGIWTGLSWFGITEFLQMRPSSLFGAALDWRVPVVGAVASGLLIALLPLATIAWASIARQQKRLDGTPVSSQPWLFWLCLIICTLFAITPLTAKLNEVVVYPREFVNPFGFKVAHKPPENLPVLAYGKQPSILMIACACAIFLMQEYLLMRLLYPVLRRANVIIFIAIVLFWFGPLCADLIYYNLQPGNVEPRMDHFALLSPLGTIIEALDKPPQKTWRGLAVQAAVTLIPAAIFLMMQARFYRKMRRKGFPATLLPPTEEITYGEPVEPASS